MRWSQLKHQIEARFSPEVQKRVSVNVTRYRKAHDEEGELWLSLDGLKIYGSSFYQFVKEADQKLQGEPAGRVPEWTKDDVKEELASLGVADHAALMKALFLSLSQSVEDMLVSMHPLVRAIAVLDSRFGKRRLAILPVHDEH